MEHTYLVSQWFTPDYGICHITYHSKPQISYVVIYLKLVLYVIFSYITLQSVTFYYGTLFYVALHLSFLNLLYGIHWNKNKIYPRHCQSITSLSTGMANKAVMASWSCPLNSALWWQHHFVECAVACTCTLYPYDICPILSLLVYIWLYI